MASKKRKPAGPALSDADMLSAVEEGVALAEWGRPAQAVCTENLIRICLAEGIA